MTNETTSPRRVPARGLADRLDVPVGAIRAGFVVTALLGGPGIAAYIAGILLIPSHNQSKAPAVAWVERTFDGAPPDRRT
jgi:phage shock protein PspC (stress-responsive transcriptional regulator)